MRAKLMGPGMMLGVALAIDVHAQSESGRREGPRRVDSRRGTRTGTDTSPLEWRGAGAAEKAVPVG